MKLHAVKHILSIAGGHHHHTFVGFVSMTLKSHRMFFFALEFSLFCLLFIQISNNYKRMVSISYFEWTIFSFSLQFLVFSLLSIRSIFTVEWKYHWSIDAWKISHLIRYNYQSASQSENGEGEKMNWSLLLLLLIQWHLL